MNCIDSIYALNSFYLKKLGDLQTSDGNIHCKMTVENEDDEMIAYRMALQVMAQTTSIVFGYLVGLSDGNIKKAEEIMDQMTARQRKDLSDKYGMFLKKMDRN
jgi:hypothetical protein